MLGSLRLIAAIGVLPSLGPNADFLAQACRTIEFRFFLAGDLS